MANESLPPLSLATPQAPWYDDWNETSLPVPQRNRLRRIHQGLYGLHGVTEILNAEDANRMAAASSDVEYPALAPDSVTALYAAAKFILTEVSEAMEDLLSDQKQADDERAQRRADFVDIPALHTVS